MNQQEFASQVGELAARIGYPMPSVDWSTDKKYHARGIVLDPNGDFGQTLRVHRRVEESMPAVVQEFLVAQELLQARLGVWRQRRWLRGVVVGLSGLSGFAAVVAATRLVDSYLVAFLVGCTVAAVVSRAIQVMIVAIWSRWFVRRADLRLVEVLGRDKVTSALAWWVESGWRPSVQWLLNGATPTPKERLRRLDTSITD